jgi:hypothetical protein
MRSLMGRYQADEICVDRGCDKEAGKPCQNCIDDDAGIPTVLRPSIPEDRREPPPTPPYARCVEDHSLPENAGRHQAPAQRGITDNARDLQNLRSARAFPRPR